MVPVPLLAPGTLHSAPPGGCRPRNTPPIGTHKQPYSCISTDEINNQECLPSSIVQEFEGSVAALELKPPPEQGTPTSAGLLPVLKSHLKARKQIISIFTH